MRVGTLRHPALSRTAAADSNSSNRSITVAKPNEILDGVLGCHCCIFPVVDGIPVMHLLPSATTAREHIEAKRPDLAQTHHVRAG